jgi:hypothetical protein
MAQHKVEPIVFNVPSGEIRGSVLGERSSSGKFAVVLPGAGYSCTQPQLYFLVQILLRSGHQVLTIDSLYSEDKTWLSLPTEEEALRYVENDADPLFQQIQSQFPGGIHTLVGRSLGTYSIACALEKGAAQPLQIIWQSPSLPGKWAILKNFNARGLVIIGKADPRFEVAAAFLPESHFIAEGADHAMEFADPLQSIELLKQITGHTRDWLEDSSVDISQLKRNLQLTPEQRLIEHQSALELCDELARAGRNLHEQSQ